MFTWGEKTQGGHGRYNSKSEVLREGIRLIQEREARLTVLDQALARGIDDEDAKRTKPLADVVARLERK
ncbi:MAG: type II toxin-antitoxin system ParD family antitoxin [Rhizobiaceae bacterium]